MVSGGPSKNPAKGVFLVDYITRPRVRVAFEGPCSLAQMGLQSVISYKSAYLPLTILMKSAGP